MICGTTAATKPATIELFGAVPDIQLAYVSDPANSPTLPGVPVEAYRKHMGRFDYRTLPNLLRKYRKVRGLQQGDAARLLGLSRSRISRWEKGMCLPTLANAIKLAILYRVMVDALFDDLVRVLHKEVLSREEKERTRPVAPQHG